MRNVSFSALTLIFAGVFSLATPLRAEDTNVSKLLDAIPGDMAVVFVVPDMEGFEKRLDGLMQRIDPSAGDSGLLDELRSEIPHVGEWADFSKPFAIAQADPGNEDEKVFFGTVPGFKDKVEAVAGASETEGLWKLPINEGENARSVYVRTKNGIVIGSTSRMWVDHAGRSKTSVGKQLKSRKNLLADRDVLIHFNMEPVRNRALTGLAGVAQMAPMFMMMAGPQAQANPAAFKAVADSVVEAATKFVEQVEYIDLTLGITADDINATFATTYKDGPIRNYLTSQRPASMPFFTEIDDQPYIMAMAYHMPGNGGGLLSYVSKETLEVAKAAHMGQAAQGGQGSGGEEGGEAGADGEKQQADLEELEKGIKLVTKLYEDMHAANFIFHMGPDGIVESGDIVTPDAEAFVKGYREVFEFSNDIMTYIGMGGANYEYVGQKEIEGNDVDEYSIKLDANNPAMAPAAAMFTNDTKLMVGQAGDRVRFHLGNEEGAKQVFDGKVAKSLADSPFVQKALKTMSGNPNMVMLIDPANMMPFIAAMSGQGAAMKNIPPSQPAAIGIYLSGQPARMKLHVPIKTIESITRSMAPDEPM